MHEDNRPKNRVFPLLAILLAVSVLPSSYGFTSRAEAASGNRFSEFTIQRDHLSLLESDRVREARDIERRVEVFIKVIERRLLALTDSQAATTSRQAQRDLERWGELPTGTRAELLSDLSRTLNEAITNIDDAATRPNASPEHGTRALRKLAEAATRFLAQLTPMRTNLSEETPEREQLEQAIEHAQAIVEAASRTGQTNSN